jgi:hypothetical protein
MTQMLFVTLDLLALEYFFSPQCPLCFNSSEFLSSATY